MKQNSLKNLRRYFYLSTFLLLSFSITILLFKGDSTPPLEKLSVDLTNKIALDDLDFSLDSVKKEATFTGIAAMSTYPTTLEIPDKLEILSGSDITTYTVVAINVVNNKVPNYVNAMKNLTAIVVPKSVNSISIGCFYGAVRLQHLELPFSGKARGTLLDEGYIGWVFGQDHFTFDGIQTLYRPYVNVNEVGKRDFYFPPDLSKVIVSDETHLDDRAFFALDFLKYIEIGDRCVTFGDSVFNSCTNLLEVKLPALISAYGKWMFGDCENLTKVNLPVSLTQINYATFYNCKNLVDVVIPSNVKKIEDGAFFGCEKLFTNQLTAQNTKVELILGEALTEIGNEAFRNCKSITDVHIPRSVSKIGSAAFNGCQNLKNMTLPFVGQEAGNQNTEFALFGFIFGKVGAASSIDNAPGITPPQGVGFTEVRQYVDANKYSIYYIPSILETVTVTNETVISYGAFQNCTMIKTLSILDKVNSIAEGALKGSNQIRTLSLPFLGNKRGSNLGMGYIFGSETYTNSYASLQPGNKTYYIPNTLTEIRVTNEPYIRANSFYNYPTLTDIIIGNATTTSEGSVIYGCSNLTNLTIPFVGIQRGAYYTRYDWWYSNYIRNTMGWWFSSQMSNETYGLTYAWTDYDVRRVPLSLKQLTISDDPEIASQSFINMVSLERINISDATETIQANAMSGCVSLTSLYLPFIGKDRNPSSISGSEYVLGHLFGSGGEGFYKCDQFVRTSYIPNGLSSVSVSNRSNSIADYAFANMNSLVNFYTSMNVGQLGKYAFYNCTQIREITMPNAGFSIVGDHAFENTGVASLDQVLPNTVKNIGSFAFANTPIIAVDLTKYDIIGDYAFNNCLGITSVNIPTTVQKLGKGAFANCKNLRTATLGKNMVSQYLFENCLSLQAIDLTNVSITIPEGMFKNCINLRNVTQDPNTIEIGKEAFYGCSSLTYFNFAITNKKIGDSAFAYCTGIEFVTINKQMTHIGSGVFTGCNKSFYIRTYLREPDRPSTWVTNWNCNFPVYVIGESDDSIFIYEYNVQLEGFIIIGINNSIELPKRLVLPKSYNSVNVVGIGDSILSPSKFDATIFSTVDEIIIPKRYAYISDHVFANGKNIDLYFESNVNDYNYRDRAENLVSHGKVFFQEAWKYNDRNEIIYDISQFFFTFDGTYRDPLDENSMYFEFAGRYFKPAYLYCNTSAILVGNATDSDLCDNINFQFTYRDNYHIGRASIEIKTSNSKFYGTKNIAFTITKPILYIEKTLTGIEYTGKTYRFDIANNVNISGLPAGNFSYSGTLETKSENVGTYIGSYGIYWLRDFRITLDGKNVTDDYQVDISRVTIQIIKAKIYLEWQGGKWVGNYYVFEYTGNEIVPEVKGISTNTQTEVKFSHSIRVLPEPLIRPSDSASASASVVGYDSNNVEFVNNPNNVLENETINYKVVKANLKIKIDIEYYMGEFEEYWSLNNFSKSYVNITGLAKGSVLTGELRSNDYAVGVYTSQEGSIFWGIVPEIYRMENGSKVIENSYYNIILDVVVNIKHKAFEYDFYIENKVYPVVDGVITYQTDGNPHDLSVRVHNASNPTILYLYAGGEFSAPFSFTDLNLSGYQVGVKINQTRYLELIQNIRLKVLKSDVSYSSLTKEYDGLPVDPDSKVKKGNDQIISYQYYMIDSNNVKFPIASAPKEIGKYEVRAICNEGAFFNAMDRIIPFEITKRKIYIDVTGAKTYDGKSADILIDTANVNTYLLSGDRFTGNLLTYSSEPGLYVGSINGNFVWKTKWSVFNTDGSNNTDHYEIVFLGEYTIRKLTMTVNSFGAVKDYDGSYYGITINVLDPTSQFIIYYSENRITADNDPDKADNGAGDWRREAFYYNKPGTYTVYYKVVCNRYYTYYGNESITINPLDIQYEALDQSVPFDNLPHSYTGLNILAPWYTEVSYSYDGSGFTTKPFEFTGFYNHNTVYPLKIRLKAENYNTVEFNVNFTITANTLSSFNGLVTFTDTEIFYDGARHTFGVQVDPNITGYKIEYSLTGADKSWTTSPFYYSAVNEYPVYVKVSKYLYNDYITTVNFKIKDRIYNNVTATGFTVDYDGMGHYLEIVGMDRYPDGELFYSVGNVGSGKKSSLNYRVDQAFVDAGTYLIYLSLKGKNYVEYIFPQPVQVTINRITPSISYDEQQFEYMARPILDSEIILNTIHDGTPIFTYYETSGGVIGRIINNPQEVGRYYFKVKYFPSKNCEYIEADGYFNIVPRKLILEYQSQLEYTGHPLYPTFRVISNTSDVFTIAIKRVIGGLNPVEVGSYQVEISFLPANNRYYLESNIIEYEIIPRIIKIEMYDTFDWDGINAWQKTSGWEMFSSNLLLGHQLKLSMVCNNTVREKYIYDTNDIDRYLFTMNVTFQILDQYGNDVTNYYQLIAYVEVQYKYPELIVSCDDVIVDYDNRDHLINPQILTVVLGYQIYYSLVDNIESYLPTLKIKEAGVYTVYFRIIASGYEEYFGSAKLVINKIELNIEVDPFDEVYDGEGHKLKFAITNINDFNQVGDVKYYPKKTTDIQDIMDLYSDFNVTDPLYMSGLYHMVNAGTYYAVVYYPGTNNYREKVLIREITLQQRGIHIQFNPFKNIVIDYNETRFSTSLAGATLDQSDLVPGHILRSSLQDTFICTISQNAGVYVNSEDFEFQYILILNLGVDVSSNYCPIVDTIRVEISKIALTILDVYDVEREYDGKIASPRIETPSDGPVIYEFLLVDENKNPIIGAVPTPTAYDVGYYKVIVKIGEGTNYWAYTNSDKVAYVKINPKKTEIVWENTAQVYNGEILNPTGSFTDVSGNTIPVTLEIANTSIFVGQYIVKANFYHQNYVFVNQEISFSVEKYVVDVIINEESLYLKAEWVKVFTQNSFTPFLSGHTLTGSLTQKMAAPGYFYDLNQFNWLVDVRKDHIDVTECFEFVFDINLYLYTDNIEYIISDELTYKYTGTAFQDDLNILNPIGKVKPLYSRDNGATFDATRPSFITPGVYYLKIQLSCEGYNTVVVDTKITITLGDSYFRFITDISREYNGLPVDYMNSVNFSGKFNGTISDLIFTFYEDGSNVNLGNPPINVGRYRVVVTSTADTGANLNYTTLYEEIYFNISPKKFVLDLSNEIYIVDETTVGGPWSKNDVISNSPTLIDFDRFTYTLNSSSVVRGSYIFDQIIYPTTYFFVDNGKSFDLEWKVENTSIPGSYTDISNNYCVQLNFKLIVKYMDIDAEPINFEGFYDGNSHFGGVNIITSGINASILYGENITNIIRPDAIGYIEPGIYKVFYRISARNYEDHVGFYTVNIKKSDRIVGDVSNLSKIYDGTTVGLPAVFEFLNGTDTDVAGRDRWIIKFFTAGGSDAMANAIFANSYTYELTIEGNNYYNPVVYRGSFEITRRKVDITGSDTMQYNTTSYTFNQFNDPLLNPFTISGLLSGDYIEGTIQTDNSIVKSYYASNNSIRWIGNRKIINSINQEVTQNYEINLDITVTITLGEIHYDLTDRQVPFTGEKYFLEITPIQPRVAKIEYSTDGINWQTTNIGYIAKGIYTIYFKITAQNYAPKIVSGQLEIGKNQATIQISNMGKIYDGNYVTNPTVITNSDCPTNRFVYTFFSQNDPTTEINRPKNVGNYIVRVLIPDTDNYRGKEEAFEFEITPFKLTFTYDMQSFIYNGLVQKPRETVTFAGNENPTIQYMISNTTLGDATSTDYGDYELTLLVNDPNYIVDNGSNIVRYRINQRTIRINFSTSRKFTGNIFTFNPYTDFIIDNMVGIHTFKSKLVSKVSDIGNYNFTDFDWDTGTREILNSDGDNVSKNYDLIIAVAFTIDFNDIQVSVQNFEGNYDGLDHGVNISVQLNSPYVIYYDSEQNGSFNSRQPITRRNAGLTRFYIKVVSDGYRDVVRECNITIFKQESTLTLDVSKLTKVYDALTVYNPIITYSGDRRNDALVVKWYAWNPITSLYDTECSIPSNVGKYKYRVVLNETMNYQEITSEILFEITKRDLIIELANQGKVYDLERWRYDLTNNNSSIKGMVAGQRFSGTVQTRLANAGTYDRQSDFSWYDQYRIFDRNNVEVTMNYTIIFDIFVVITKADITYTKSNYEGVYDGLGHTIMVKVTRPSSGYVIKYSEDENNYSENLILKTVGITTIYFTIEAENYNTIRAEASIIITPLDGNVERIVYDPVKEFDGNPYTDPIITTSSTGAITITYYLASDTLKEHPLTSAPTNAGMYVFTIHVASDGIVADINVVKSFEITPKEVSVIWNSLQFVYSGTTKLPSGKIVDIHGNDIICDVAGGEIKVGTYQATATLNDVNYRIMNETVQYEITKKPIDLPEIATNLIFKYLDTIIIKDKFGNIYEVNNVGIIYRIINLDGSEVDNPGLGYKITYDRNPLAGTHYFVCSLIDSQNTEWTSRDTADINIAYVVEQKLITQDQIQLDFDRVQIFTGAAVRPDLNVYFVETTAITTFSTRNTTKVLLEENTDYSYSCADNNAPGVGSMTITNLTTTSNYRFQPVSDTFNIIASEPQVLELIASSKIQFVEYAVDDLTGELTKNIITNKTANQQNVYLGHLYQGRTIQDILSQFINNVSSIKVYDGADTLIDPADYATRIIFTGMKIVLVDENAIALDTIELVLNGDGNGDGLIDINDLLALYDIINITSGNSFEDAIYKAFLIKDSMTNAVGISDLLKFYDHINLVSDLNDLFK